jgi:hypothetical protein
VKLATSQKKRWTNDWLERRKCARKRRSEKSARVIVFRSDPTTFCNISFWADIAHRACFYFCIWSTCSYVNHTLVDGLTCQSFMSLIVHSRKKDSLWVPIFLTNRVYCVFYSTVSCHPFARWRVGWESTLAQKEHQPNTSELYIYTLEKERKLANFSLFFLGVIPVSPWGAVIRMSEARYLQVHSSYVILNLHLRSTTGSMFRLLRSGPSTTFTLHEIHFGYELRIDIHESFSHSGGWV